VIRLLLDQGIPRSTVARIQDRGFATRHVADIGLERASDLDIMQAAIQLEQGAMVTVTERSIRVHRLPVCRHLGPTGIQER
jgi:predicted nuclease of predicted toxin-antitoxin system